LIAPRKARLAVVSPFIDKKHGTERRVAEWIAQLSSKYEIHIYSQDVRDVDLTRVTWHRIWKVPGPHIVNFLWWVFANRALRIWHARSLGLRHDLVFSSGINCLDADAVSVHIVFAEYVSRVRDEISFSRNPVRAWPRLLHRQLYYRVVTALEGRVYGSESVSLVLIARRTEAALGRFYGRREGLPVVYGGLDHDIFNPERRLLLRENARKDLGLSGERFALVIVSNDGRNKGLPVLVRALSALSELPIDLLVVTREDPAPYLARVREADLEGRFQFLPPRDDIEFYYAAADAYVGPSLEDTFAQPPAEAMACGMPVIVSANNGTSEIMTDGVDALILLDPTDASSLAAMIRRLYEDRELAAHLGKCAHETARQYTWERNGRELSLIFEELLERKSQNAPRTVTGVSSI
jgi:glycosyltransferase involved in cell wall biosynthesis